MQCILGKPPPALTWWRGRIQVDDTYEVSSHIVRNELQLESLTRRDLMTDFTCQASNNNMSAPVKTSVTLDLNCKYTHMNTSEYIIFNYIKCVIS